MLVLDLSNNNATPDWSRLKSAGVVGVQLKASEGVTYVDPTYKARRDSALKAGLFPGAYHFARPDLHPDPTQEAHNFCGIVEALGTFDMRPSLDFETWSPHLTVTEHVEWAREWNAIIKKELGLWPMFYSYSAMLADLAPGTKGVPIGAGLWLASYSRNSGKEYPATIPAPWKNYVMHQFTSQGTVAGVPFKVDISSAAKIAPLLAHPRKARFFNL